MQEPGDNQKRFDIPYFDGVNSLVGHNIGKKTEFFHAENARSKTIGTIEKREGQTVLGTDEDGYPFVTDNNYGLFPFKTVNMPNGFYRVSVPTNSSINISVSDDILSTDTVSTGENAPFTIFSTDSVDISESVNGNDGYLSTIYYIDGDSRWIPLSGKGQNIAGGLFDYTYAEGNIFMVNFNDRNRYITSDGLTVKDSSDADGHLYNTPEANRINYYKGRLYIADFVRDGVRYKTTVLRSSYAMGVIALINEDSSVGDTESGTFEVTDNKYFYSDSGANTYEVYRGINKVATLTVSDVNETSIVATILYESGYTSLLSSDEIWINGTYDGEKVFRWVNNPTVSGKDVKQYDTFKLSGGENEGITMLTNIGNVMLISNPSSMASWNDYVLEGFDLDIGCASKKGYVKVLGTLYFIHYTGIYSTSGSVPKLLSSKVERYIQGATKEGIESAASGKKGTSVFFAIGDVTLYRQDGSVDKVLRDVCLEYNLIQENWFVHTNVKATEFSTFIESNNPGRLEFTDSSGNKAVKEFLSGNSDDGKEIFFRIDPTTITLQKDYENVNNIIAIIIESDRGSSMKTFIKLGDDGEFYALEGEARKGLSVIKASDQDNKRGRPPVGRLLTLSLRDSSNQRCKISRMSVIFSPVKQNNPENME